MFVTMKKKSIILLLCGLLVVTSVIVSCSAIKPTFIPKQSYCIVIDAGHGGIDPGSIGYKTKVKESTINLAVSLILAEKIRGMGLGVVLTRPTEDGLYGLSTTDYKKRDMKKRREIIEKVNPNMVISVHMNSYIRHNLRGAQVFYDKGSEQGHALALAIQDQFAAKLAASDKGVAIGDYYMLKCTPAASVIAECGFLSNEEDEKLLIDPKYQELIADCIFAGIVNFLNGE